MGKEHILADLVKSYLLGEIDDDRAAALEEKYFTDPGFLAQVKAVEDELIEDYLDGRLSPPRKASFENRYLHVPELIARLEAVRSTQAAHRSVLLRRYLAAAAAVILSCGCLVWYGGRARPKAPSVSIARFSPTPAAFYVHLTPGVQKGDGAMVQFAQPAEGTKVSLILELPGLSKPVDAISKLSTVGVDLRQTPIWRSEGTIRSTTVSTGQQLELQLESTLLPPADYILQVESPIGNVLDVYLFGVNGR